MASTIKVNNIQNQCGANIINESSNTITIGASGDTVSLASGASQSGFGRTGTVDWQTSSIKTSTFTAATGEGYFCDTNGGTFTVNLPAGSAGAIVSVQDYRNTFDTNALTVEPNGSEKINGGAGGDPITLNTEGQGVTLVYIDSTIGWRSVQDNTFAQEGSSFISATGGTITEDGDFKIHTFTGPGTFEVTKVGATPVNKFDYLVVAGGGGGGDCRGGGGGAGGLRFHADTSTAPQPGAPALPLNNFPSGTSISGSVATFPIAVGGGGAGATATPAQGVTGSASTFSTITSAGGGGGASDAATSGVNGGSGGGGSNSGSGGTGNTPPVSPAQGTNGGNSGGGSSGAGGGGALVAGGPGPNTGTGTVGGDGAGFGPAVFGSSNGVSCGSFRYFGGGGGGGSGPAPGGGANKPGGKGGGGIGKGSTPVTTGGSATANTGGGGGGGAGSASNGGAGGSGIVVIRYKFQ